MQALRGLHYLWEQVLYKVLPVCWHGASLVVYSLISTLAINRLSTRLVSNPTLIVGAVGFILLVRDYLTTAWQATKNRDSMGFPSCFISSGQHFHFLYQRALSRRTESNRQPPDYAGILRFGRKLMHQLRYDSLSPVIPKPVSVGSSVKVRRSTIKATPASYFYINIQ